MNINPKYVIYHDLIGLNTFARLKSKSSNSDFLDIGCVIDETKNMLITVINEKEKKYIKKNHVFRFIIPKQDKAEERVLEVNGLKIIGLPENRLRNLRKRRRLK